ncbi:MAG: HemK2/MTQ2 family protein methyltransferase [archaeon]
MSEIYSPSDDSYLMIEILKSKIPLILRKNKNMKVIEIGSGSGILLETLFGLGIKKENIFSCDINPQAVRHCRKLGFNCIKSDLFSEIRERFDLIIFNPPYLPLDKKEPKESRIATTGGKQGSEIINKFLMQAKNHLEKNGKIFFLLSSLTGGIDFLGYRKRILDSKKLFFERLFVWELR